MVYLCVRPGDHCSQIFHRRHFDQHTFGTYNSAAQINAVNRLREQTVCGILADFHFNSRLGVFDYYNKDKINTISNIAIQPVLPPYWINLWDI
jgi:hypothetical protein